MQHHSFQLQINFNTENWIPITNRNKSFKVSSGECALFQEANEEQLKANQKLI